MLDLFPNGLADAQARAAAAPAAEFAPSFAREYEAAQIEALRFGNIDWLERNRRELVQDALDRYQTATGRALPNPEDVQQDQQQQRAALYGRIRAEFDTYRAQNPGADLAFPTDDDIQSGAEERARGARASRQALDAQREAAGGSFAGAAGSMLGSVVGSLGDPLNLLTLPLGAAAASGILRTALVTGAIGGATQAANEATQLDARQAVAPDYTTGEAVGNVAGAAVAGAVLGGGAKAAGMLAGKSLEWWRGRKLTREQRDALNVLEAEQQTAASNPLPAGVQGEQAHVQALETAARQVEAGQPVDVRDLLDPVMAPPTVENGGLVALDPRTVGVDAELFQYKAGGDDAGVTDRLRGVTEWRPERAGVSIVYEFADGRRVVADGHQRRGLAMRLMDEGAPGPEPRLNAVLYREADGFTPEQVRALAAAKNIAEGTGSAIDAAKVLRDGDPAVVRSLPPTSALVRDAKGLAGLADEPFGMVVNGVVPEPYGAIVGRLVPADMQPSVMGLLAKLNPANRVEAESIVRQAMDAGATRSTQASLFGDEVVTESLYLERARVLDRALKTLKRDRAVFSTLTAEEARIAAAGNTLDTAANLARVDEDGAAVQTLATLANRKGPISDALSAAARRAKDEERFDGAVRDFVEAVRAEAAQPVRETVPAGLAARTADEMADEPTLGPALDMDVNRLMASRDIEVPTETADGAVVKRSALELMEDADREVAQSAQIALCVFGQAAE